MGKLFPALFVLALQGTALFLFAAGFFLTRLELGLDSECDPSALLEAVNATHLYSGKPRDGCWTERSFGRVVVVIVDALRFDFVEWQPEERVTAEEQLYTNKMRRVAELLRDRPASSILCEFEADPPTVTMQRLKGLTTGGLPTFFEFRKNFASPSIEEDTWVRPAG